MKDLYLEMIVEFYGSEAAEPVCRGVAILIVSKEMKKRRDKCLRKSSLSGTG